MLESLDCVKPGEYLVCSRGAPLRKKNEYQKVEYDSGPEGLLVRVLAVSPPMFLARYFPFPGAEQGTPSGVTCYTWGRMGWSKASKGYVREYLKAGGWKKDGQKRAGIEAYVIDVLTDDATPLFKRAKRTR